MKYIQDHLFPLDHHVEKNLYELYRVVAQLRVGEDRRNYSWVDAYPSEWPRYIFDTSLKGDHYRDLLEELEQGVKANKLPPKLIISLARSSDQVIADIRRRFTQRLEWMGMAAPFDTTLISSSPTASLSSCEVRRVRSEEELCIWAKLANLTFYGRETGEEPGVFSSLLPLEPVRFYLGYWDDKPVATSMGFMHDQIMGVYNITTLEAYRGRGIATAVTKAVLDEGRRCGCRGAILQARPAARGVYSSLGFESVGPLYIFDLGSPVLR